VASVAKWRVFDISKIRLKATEHQYVTKLCSACKAEVRGEFPRDVQAPVQYGSRIQSCALYFLHQHLIPEDRVREILADCFNTPIATATLVTKSVELFDQLNKFEENVTNRIQTAPVKHLDETGFRVHGKTQWLHVASTAEATWDRVSERRGDLPTDL
jgi:transposase